MPGPPPKDASLRARRNKTATAAKLRAVGDDEGVDHEARHPLPERRDEDGNVIPWHAMATDLWREVWGSPMAAEYLDADVPGLYVLAALTDAYWKGIDQGKIGKELAAEIRLQRIDYGLTPIARRRLQWEVERAESAQDQGRRRRVTPADRAQAAAAGDDPRRLLGG